MRARAALAPRAIAYWEVSYTLYTQARPAQTYAARWGTLKASTHPYICTTHTSNAHGIGDTRAALALRAIAY